MSKETPQKPAGAADGAPGYPSASGAPGAPGSWGDRLLRLLGRTTTTGSVIPAVDGLRCLAFMLVMVFHVHGYVQDRTGLSFTGDPFSARLGRVAETGSFGVQVFFAISGFIIGLPFARHYLDAAPLPSLGDFYSRRLLRLGPPYVINMVVIFLLLWLVNHEPFGELVKHLLASLGYVHNLIYDTTSSINTVAWSLEIEMQFYLVAPLLGASFALRRSLHRRLLWIGMGVAVMLMRRFAPGHHFWLFGYAEHFLVGFLLLDGSRSLKSGAARPSALMDALSLASWAVLLAALMNRGSWISGFLQPICLFLGLAGILHGRWLIRLFANRWIAAIGGMCYTLYLWHPFTMSITWKALARRLEYGSQWEACAVFLALATLVTLPVAAVLFLTTEKPFMRRDWLTRLLKRPGHQVASSR